VHWCGGSIIDANHILTAAHCLDHGISTYRVHAGENNLESDDGTEQVLDIAEIIIHPEYLNGEGTNANDIAILRLAFPLAFNDAVQPIALPNPGHISTGVFQTSGWGALTQGGGSPDVLQKVQVPLVEDAQCAEYYGSGQINGDIQICVNTPLHNINPTQSSQILVSLLLK